MNKALMILFFLGLAGSAFASLNLKVDQPQFSGSKTVVKLTMRNTFTNAVESARAAIFLLDDKGKMVGQKAEWVIGGTKDKPGLPAEASTDFFVVIATDKPSKTTKVIFTRIILANGEVIEAGKGFKVEE